MYKKLKIFFVAMATMGIVLLGTSGISMAAYNDVTLTTDTVINVADINLNVSGASGVLETITVSTSSFSFTLQPGSSLQVISPDKRVLATDAGAQYIGNRICTTEQSVLGHYSNAGSPIITITPSASTCTGAPSNFSTGYASTPISSTATTSNALKATTTLNATSSGSTITITKSTNTPYARVLALESEGNDVVILQTFLQSKGFLIMPQGVAKGYFGQATKRALAKYQSNRGLPPIGVFDPATRAKIEIESDFRVDSTNVTKGIVYSKNLKLGSKGNDVALLQTFLQSKGLLIIPQGVAKGYFGQATKKALIEYQESVNISAIGVFGPATRAYMNTLR